MCPKLSAGPGKPQRSPAIPAIQPVLTDCPTTEKVCGQFRHKPRAFPRLGLYQRDIPVPTSSVLQKHQALEGALRRGGHRAHFLPSHLCSRYVLFLRRPSPSLPQTLPPLPPARLRAVTCPRKRLSYTHTHPCTHTHTHTHTHRPASFWEMPWPGQQQQYQLGSPLAIPATISLSLTWKPKPRSEPAGKEPVGAPAPTHLTAPVAGGGGAGVAQEHGPQAPGAISLQRAAPACRAPASLHDMPKTDPQDVSVPQTGAHTTDVSCPPVPLSRRPEPEVQAGAGPGPPEASLLAWRRPSSPCLLTGSSLCAWLCPDGLGPTLITSP